ncbi:MAG: dihydroorotate dehydrogenase [Lachnospiraceae bacterium]|nr:dihydroorotate dehydrogenase [Lachnospiraceae bacterium]
MRPDLSVCIAGVTLKNPVMTASGTFGSGKEYGAFFDISRLGAVVTKGIAPVPWKGNPVPRVAETPSGMLNAIGLQGPGVDTFMAEDLPYLAQYGVPVIANVCGHSEEEYLTVVEKLSDTDVSMLEINVSCPNVREGGIAFGTDPGKVCAITQAVKKITKKPVIIKLSPNVTDIRETAKAAEAGGADCVSLINTLIGMKIDVRTRRFILANRTGGLSGPAIHPVAVRMVYDVSHAVGIPVIGMGGISTAEDALEMILAGATGIAVGTAFFHDPQAAVKVIEGMEVYLAEQKISSVRELVGAVS